MSDISIGEVSTAGATFRIGVVLSKTFDLFTRQFGKFMLLTLVPMVPLLVLALIALNYPATPGKLGVLGGITALLTVFLGIVAQATTLYGAFQAMRGQPFSIGQSLQIGLARTLPVLGVAILVSLAAGLAAILLVVPGLIVFCMCYVSIPVCVIERPGVTASMSRSADLTKGYRWSIFGLLLLLTIASGVVTFILSRLDGGVVGVLIYFAWRIIAAAFASVLVAVVYHDLRVAKEGIDIESLANVFD